MTTKRVFCLYILVGILAAQYSISGRSEETLFSYGELVDSVALSSATGFLIVGLAFFLFGSFAANSLFQEVSDASIVGSKRSVSNSSPTLLPLWQSFGALCIVTFYSYLFVDRYLDSGLPSDLTERVFENKFSTLFMMLLAYFGYSSMSHVGTTALRVVILGLSLFVVVVDGSRSGLVPLLGLLVGAFVARKYVSSLLLTYLIFFGASYSITGRLLDDRFSLEVLRSYLFPDTDLLVQAVQLIFDYVFAFSILNFSFMAFVSVPTFTTTQLLASINPLPSSLLDPYVIDSLRFDDRTRAIGGPAEMFLVEPAVFMFGFFVLGMVAAYADTVVRSRFRFIVLLMFLLATIIFFQYSLRTSARMFTAVIVVIFLLRRWIESANRERAVGA